MLLFQIPRVIKRAVICVPIATRGQGAFVKTMARDLPWKAYKLNKSEKILREKADKEKGFIPGHGAIKTNTHFSTLLRFYWTGHTGSALSTDFP